MALAALPISNAAAAVSRTIQPTPNPVGAQASFLRGVSCPAATACTAVGFFQNTGGNDLMLAERWDGTSWTLQNTPNPSGGKFSELNGVSCASATACMGVGGFAYSVGPFLPVAESWNGTSWTAQLPPAPSAATSSQLNGVSCTSATACTAVGTTYS
ncbi:MAG: hypothetical protein M3024_08250, partial [Candidatus Dormibacteraeota bacterium]|nr:hypothetical protein [Candidatus Dormibacteraeota bacterium]